MAGVRTTHSDYDRLSPRWQRVRDVIAGQDAMHTAAERYLPKLKDETPEDYKARVNRSDFFNATWRTIDALGGMAGRKPPTVDVPAAIEPYLNDISMSGTTMEGLAKESVEEVLGPGRIGILVDHPAPPDNVTAITVAAAQSLGLRPTLQLYTAESIRNWKFARINNAWVLSMVVLGETEMVEEDEFTAKAEARYRVLDLDNGTYRQRVFKVEKEQDVLLSEVVPLMNGKPLDFIPFVICGAGGKNDCIDEPPLIDLVDKNVAHYQVNSDYRHGLHFAGLPTLFLAGMDPPTEGSPRYYIGSSAAIQAQHAEAKASFIEFQGQGLGAIEKGLDRLETQMARLGAATVVEQQGQITATANVLDRQAENSVLAKIVQSVSEALEQALTWFSEWAGADGEITYQINRDFLPAGMDAQTLQAYLAAVIAGKMSDREFFDLLQRGDVIDGKVTYEEHQEQIAATAPAPVKPVVPPGEQAAA